MIVRSFERLRNPSGVVSLMMWLLLSFSSCLLRFLFLSYSHLLSFRHSFHPYTLSINMFFNTLAVALMLLATPMLASAGSFRTYFFDGADCAQPSS